MDLLPSPVPFHSCNHLNDLKQSKVWVCWDTGDDNHEQVWRHDEVLSLVPSYPDQQTRYRSLQLHCWRSILESRITEILYLGLPSTSIRGGGGCTQFGIVLDMEGLSWETWNMGWIKFMELSSWSVKEWEPACVMIIYSPRFFSESFFEGCVEQRYLALMNTWSLTLKSGTRVHQASMGPWYHC